jgi:hypothetical protein
MPEINKETVQRDFNSVFLHPMHDYKTLRVLAFFKGFQDFRSGKAFLA